MLWHERICDKCVCFGIMIALVIGVFTVGCGKADAQRPRGKRAYGPSVIPQPHGSFVRRFQNLQAAKAEESDFVIFLHEWYQGGIALGPYGQYHLNQIAYRLPQVPFPVVIQPVPNPSLNAMRRQLVVQSLIKNGIADADSRVIIDFPKAEGLRYESIEQIWINSLEIPEYATTIPGYFGYGGFGLRSGYLGGYRGFGPYRTFARPLFSGF